MKALNLKYSAVEDAWEYAQLDFDDCEYNMRSFLNLSTGEVICPESDDDLEEACFDKNLAEFPGADSKDDYRTMERFVYSLEEGPTQKALLNAISGKGAFKRFKNMVFGGDDDELRDKWNHFEQVATAKEIVRWLEGNGIQPVWDCDPFADS